MFDKGLPPAFSLGLYIRLHTYTLVVLLGTTPLYIVSRNCSCNVFEGVQGSCCDVCVRHAIRCARCILLGQEH